MRYQHPLIVRSYSLDELRTDAAACTIYQVSDQALKQDIETVERPLEQLGRASG